MKRQGFAQHYRPVARRYQPLVQVSGGTLAGVTVHGSGDCANNRAANNRAAKDRAGDRARWLRRHRTAPASAHCVPGLIARRRGHSLRHQPLQRPYCPASSSANDAAQPASAPGSGGGVPPSAVVIATVLARIMPI